jgi:hypothetical protein
VINYVTCVALLRKFNDDFIGTATATYFNQGWAKSLKSTGTVGHWKIQIEEGQFLIEL